MKRSALLLVSLIVGAGLLAGALYSMGFLGKQPPQLRGSLAGFDPGTNISYRISTPEEEILTGTAVVDKDGGLDIPPYYPAKGKKHDVLTYDINFEREGEPIDVSFIIRPDTGKTSVSAAGLNKFSNIRLEKLSKNKKTESRLAKADWAGFFKEESFGNIDFLKGKSEGLELAFFDGIRNDAREESPYIIKVQACCTACGNCQTDIERNYIAAMAGFAEQMSIVMMYQAEIVGTFFDAKQQLETQREFEKLTAQAHKEYHPSDQMCRFGSFVKTVAKTEAKSWHDKQAVNSILMAAYTGQQHGYTSEGYTSDIQSRLYQFRRVYCDRKDSDSGLDYMCDQDQDGNLTTGTIGGTDKARLNKDIDYMRTVENPYTLEVNFTDGTLEDDEEDVIALAKNLYWPVAFNNANDERFDRRNYIAHRDVKYMDARQLLAMQNVAHNTFAEIVSMKAETLNPAADSGTAFMKAMLVDFGLSAADIDVMLGEFPSYYAQMEVLTKKIYQDPDFFTNLYDKPANLDRISASIEAIGLMQARDHFESGLRREMLMSLLIEEGLQPYHDRIDPLVSREIRTLPK